MALVYVHELLSQTFWFQHWKPEEMLVYWFSIEGHKRSPLLSANGDNIPHLSWHMSQSVFQYLDKCQCQFSISFPFHTVNIDSLHCHCLCICCYSNTRSEVDVCVPWKITYMQIEMHACVSMTVSEKAACTGKWADPCTSNRCEVDLAHIGVRPNENSFKKKRCIACAAIVETCVVSVDVGYKAYQFPLRSSSLAVMAGVWLEEKMWQVGV